MPRPSPQTKKEKTKEAILREALRLFEAEGFDTVTMRALAEACGLSLGAFYYHFRNKEEIVLEFYRASFAGHAERTREMLHSRRAPKLHELMAWVCRDRFDEFSALKPALRVLAQRLDPHDSASPWHASSRKIREQSIDLFGEMVAACVRTDAKKLRLLATALWLHHLAIVGHWLFDRSAGERDSRRLLGQSARLWKALPLLLKIPGASGALSLALAPLGRVEGGRA